MPREATPGRCTSAKGYPDRLRAVPLATGANRRGQLDVAVLDGFPGGDQISQRRSVVVRVVVWLRQRGRDVEAVQQIDEALALLAAQLVVTDRSGQGANVFMSGVGSVVMINSLVDGRIGCLKRSDRRPASLSR